jgi:HSP20 family molecular chaperone IbpA
MTWFLILTAPFIAMSSIHWQLLSALEPIHQQIQTVLTQTVNRYSQSTVWVDTNDDNWISAIKTHDTATKVVIEVQLSDDQLQDLEVQISSETAVIRARSTRDMVEGFFCAGLLESTIPLPISVHPEAVWATIDHNIITLVMPKSGKIDRQRIAVPLVQRSQAVHLHESLA